MERMSLNPLFLPNAIAILKEGDEEVALRVINAKIEQLYSGSEVTLHCIFDNRCNMRTGKCAPTTMRKKKVIYAPPATVVLWEDGTKTVVKCDERDDYDAKYGLALCYMKKALGNTSRALNDVLHGEAISND
jgi:hypothetical protein